MCLLLLILLNWMNAALYEWSVIGVKGWVIDDLIAHFLMRNIMLFSEIVDILEKGLNSIIKMSLMLLHEIINKNTSQQSMQLTHRFNNNLIISIDIFVIIILLQLQAVHCHIIALWLPELLTLPKPSGLISHNLFLYLDKHTFTSSTSPSLSFYLRGIIYSFFSSFISFVFILETLANFLITPNNNGSFSVTPETLFFRDRASLLAGFFWLD